MPRHSVRVRGAKKSKDFVARARELERLRGPLHRSRSKELASGCQNRRLDFQKLGLHEGAILADSGLGADVQFYREPLALEANRNVSPLLAGRPSPA